MFKGSEIITKYIYQKPNELNEDLPMDARTETIFMKKQAQSHGGREHLEQMLASNLNTEEDVFFED